MEIIIETNKVPPVDKDKIWGDSLGLTIQNHPKTIVIIMETTSKKYLIKDMI